MSSDSSKATSANFINRPMSPATLKIIILMIFALLFLSLGLNWFLISQLFRVRQDARALVQELKPVVKDTLTQIDTDLAAFQDSTIEFTVDVNQEIPIEAQIPLNESLEVPISVTVPIAEEFETTIMMDPFQAGLEIPVDVVVPVEVEVPIDVVVPVAIDRTVPISTTVPVSLDFPIAIEVGETDLVQYIEQLRQGIAAINRSLDQVSIAGNK